MINSAVSSMALASLRSRLNHTSACVIGVPIVTDLFTNKLFKANKRAPFQGITSWRWYSAPPKRFYRKVGILESDGKYEIILDQRKLKTPGGAPLLVENEALAHAVAAEWDAQKDTIQRSSMHLTALCCTVADNPNQVTKYDLVTNICEYLDTDTILFHSKEEEGLYELQQNEWQPLIDWCNRRYGVRLRATADLGCAPALDTDSRPILHRHLMSYSFAAVHGLVFAAEALKSTVLTLACVERALPVDRAVLLSRLEEEYQVGHWGRVEWAHDLSQLDSQARVSAAVLFVHLNSCSEHLKANKSNVAQNMV